MATRLERSAIALTGYLSAVACSDPEATRGRCVSTTQSAPAAPGPKECPGANSAPGIDVSVYQGSIDWKRVRSAGIGFAFARVSDGAGTPDAEFAMNWPAMKAAGVVRGAYQFFRPAEDPVAQATLFVSMLDAAGGLGLDDLPVAMDLEVTDGVSDSELQSHAQQWLDAMQMATGKAPLLYMALDMSPHLGNRLDRYPLWVANWGVACPGLPAGWSSWIFWQTSDSGMVAGIGDSVDLDEFNGSLGTLEDVGAQAATDAGRSSAPPIDADARAFPRAAGSTDAAQVDSSSPTSPERGRIADDAGSAMGSRRSAARTDDAAGAIAPSAGLPRGQDCSP